MQIAGPTGAFIAILSGVTAKYGIDGLQAATLMAGCMLVLMGLAKLGGVIKFIPAPVIIGFTSRIGDIIFVGQWGDFVGLAKVDASAGCPLFVGKQVSGKGWCTAWAKKV